MLLSSCHRLCSMVQLNNHKVMSAFCLAAQSHESNPSSLGNSCSHDSFRLIATSEPARPAQSCSCTSRQALAADPGRWACDRQPRARGVLQEHHPHPHLQHGFQRHPGRRSREVTRRRQGHRHVHGEPSPWVTHDMWSRTVCRCIFGKEKKRGMDCASTKGLPVTSSSAGADVKDTVMSMASKSYGLPVTGSSAVAAHQS